MNQNILHLRVICSCLLLLAPRTEAHELDLAAAGNRGEVTTSTNDIEGDIEALLLATEDILIEQKALNAMESSSDNTILAVQIGANENAAGNERMDNNYLTQVTLQNVDVKEIDGKSATEAAEVIEKKQLEAIERLDAEHTTRDFDAAINVFTESNLYEGETKSERPTTDVTNEDVMTEYDATNSETPVSPAVSLCTGPGSSEDANDCRSYFACTLTATSELRKVQKKCPTDQAFDKTLLHCTRDLSSCVDVFDCKEEGTFVDPITNSSYYWCVASRLRSTYYIYHVNCGDGRFYTPALGKCFVDMKVLQNLSANYDLLMNKSPDEECVREEVKNLKAEEKIKVKEAKLREKIKRKYEKQLKKKESKDATEQAKLQLASASTESSFNCVEEGNFEAISENFYDYFTCLREKGKYKTVGMKCGRDQTFSASKGLCTL